MIRTVRNAWDNAMGRVARRLGMDERGVAAVEFAFIVPIMATLFIGSVELSQAITVDRRVTQAAHSTADLVTRTDRLCNTDAGDMMLVIEQLLKPYNSAPLAMSIVSVRADPDNPSTTTVDWSFSHNGGTTYSQGASYPLPAGMLTGGQTVVVAEARYAYTPLVFNRFTGSTLSFTEKSYLKPRGRPCVSWCNTNCATGQPF
jgi:Flp pilus assembly protein TadG